MDALFVIVPIFIGIVFMMVVVGTILHMMMFGTIFGLVARRIADASAQEAAQAAMPCSHCGRTIPEGIDQCSSCGAKR